MHQWSLSWVGCVLLREEVTGVGSIVWAAWAAWQCRGDWTKWGFMRKWWSSRVSEPWGKWTRDVTGILIHGGSTAMGGLLEYEYGAARAYWLRGNVAETDKDVGKYHSLVCEGWKLRRGDKMYVVIHCYLVEPARRASLD